ncbi:transposase family protein [Spirosoma utsteinense]|uniref:DDE Tnp4 domain-containing protein n=1 Tax=Spirosoma utsteinense TaxID=2585773 RepID=A0ABR6WEY2_9BACT|nr:transposase family protein [Spirosoma utsteinense]MBC3789169.1 hypothetical protein [Spirosoma utsteinense]MBC3795092.1 hypothetical protein [Spirosoma utsteinense]
MIITTADRYIHYVSRCWVGKSHDYRMLKHEFPPYWDWFTSHRVRLDLGYQGFGKDYDCQSVILPKKKPCKQELTAEDKAQNRQKSSERIYVEHAIGGLKQYRILSDRLRIHDCQTYDTTLEVCAGLWNFYLSN